VLLGSLVEGEALDLWCTGKEDDVLEILQVRTCFLMGDFAIVGSLNDLKLYSAIAERLDLGEHTGKRAEIVLEQCRTKLAATAERKREEDSTDCETEGYYKRMSTVHLHPGVECLLRQVN